MTAPGPPIRYIGRVIPFFGKPLWEIVLNLKNFGIGRIVIRNRYEHFPEATFYKLLEVEPHQIEYPPGLMTGNLWVERTYRGIKDSMPLNIAKDGFKPDFRLLAKHEEGNWVNRKLTPPEYLIPLPRTAPLPPLWKDILQKEGKEVPELRLLYDEEVLRYYKIAEEGQEPGYKIGPGNWRTQDPEIYKDVIWNKEEAYEKYTKNTKYVPYEDMYNSKKWAKLHANND